MSLRSHPDPSKTAQFVQELEWPQQGVARTVSYLFVDGFGFSAFGTPEPARTEMVDDRLCLVGSIFAFDIEQAVAFDIDETVELEIEIKTGPSRDLVVAYDAHGATGRVVRRRLPAAGSEWLQVTLTLERARFADRGPRGTDLIVASVPSGDGQPGLSEPMVVSRLAVHRPAADRTVRSTGALSLRVLDENGVPVAARIGLYDASGSSHIAAAGQSISVPWFDDTVHQVALRGGADEGSEPWPSIDRWVCHVDGTYLVDVPSGTYTLVVSRGHEYRRSRQLIQISAGGRAEVTVRLERWVDLPAQGWYSGDNHVHMTRTLDDDATIHAVARAEDVHVANLLAMGNLEVAYYDQFAYGEAGQTFDGGHALVSGQEDPRTSRTGHTVHLNIDSRVRHADSYFVYHETFDELRRGGALSGYAHVGTGWFDEVRGLAMDVPFGIVDLVEVLQANELHTDLWYDFLNLGYRLTPSAGSDHPYIDLIGAVRSYVRVENEFTPPRWFDSLRAGRTFVSSGPVLSLDVDGHGMGAAVSVRGDGHVTVRARAAINPDLDALDRLELVVSGQVVTVASSAIGAESLQLEYDVEAGSGAWLAARCYGQTYARAHTAPIYVVSDHGATWSLALMPAIVDRMQSHLHDLIEATTADPHDELEAWISPTDYRARWSQQQARVVARAREAHRRYDALLALAHRHAVD